MLALNKIDLVRRDKLLGLADALFRAGCFDAVFMISGLTGDGVEDLKRHLAAVDAAGPVAVSRGPAVGRAGALARRRGHARAGLSATA